jgi:DNA-directed RNA polymerase specialized sigma subunit
MNTKTQIDEYFKKHFKDLELYYNKFCSEAEKEYFPNMISELYIHIIDRMDKLQELISRNELHFYCIQYIYNQRNWNGTKFKEEILSKENYSSSLEHTNISIENNFDSEENFYIESVKYDTKLNIIRKGYLKLNLAEKVLYQKYFIDELSMRKIAKEIGVPLTSIFKSIKEIKEKILSDDCPQ